MISATGNKFSSRRGLTFVEVLVTLVVLGSGIVFIFRSFFVCIDHVRDLSCRWRASMWMEEKIIQTEMSFLQSGPSHFSPADDTLVATINNKKITFHWRPQVEAWPGINGVYSLNGVVQWEDGSSSRQMGRMAVLGL